jgi:hypothetical protein
VRYRTTPLKGLWARTKGGFYHDGRFATPQDVILHYDTLLGLLLTPQEITDLTEFLMSLLRHSLGHVHPQRTLLPAPLLSD